MIIMQPYDSKSLKYTNVSDLTFLVNRYIIDWYSHSVASKAVPSYQYIKGDKKLKGVVLYGQSPIETDIPELLFPFISRDKNWIMFDMRPYYTFDRETRTIQPKRIYDMNFIWNMNHLSGLWAVGYSKEMYNFILPQRAYARWLSSVITRSLGMSNPKEIMEVNIIATIFYTRLFDTIIDRDEERDLIKLLNRLGDDFIDRDTFTSIYKQTLDMETLEDFCAAIYKVTGNVRSKDFDVGSLIRLTQTNWLGINSKMILPLALEFPPIWIAMCYTALADRSFKKTVIGNHVEALGKRGADQAFIKEVELLIKYHME